MPKRKSHSTLDVEIDKLTNSIEESATGKSVATHVGRVLPEDRLIAPGLAFRLAEGNSSFRPRGVCLVGCASLRRAAGLIDIEDKGDHIHMHLLESARFNQGKGKLFLGVPSNLVTHACRISFARGHGGVVAFVAKTKLRQHYIDSLGAEVLRGDRLVISSARATELVERYFKGQ